MLETVLGGAATGGFGILTGLLGSVVTGITGYFERQQQMELRRMDHSHELLLLDKQSEMRGAEMEHELENAELVADAEALAGSYGHASAIGETYEWVNAVIKLTRPVLTGSLAIAAVAVSWGTLDLEMQIVYLACVSVGWWFGDRRKASK